jgi:cytochrome bd-type quinol oxidase subunit 2
MLMIEFILIVCAIAALPMILYASVYCYNELRKELGYIQPYTTHIKKEGAFAPSVV